MKVESVPSHTLCILIRRVPYGVIHAVEALRHVGGALDSGLRVNLVLVDDGVHVAKRDQQTEGSDWFNLGLRLQELIASAPAGVLHAAAEEGSLTARGMTAVDLLDGIEIIDEAELAHRLASAPVMAY